MFSKPAISISTRHRATGAHFLSEVVATLGLILVIFALARSGRGRSAHAAVGAYIGAAYFFTSSTSFANPAIAVARMMSNSFAGIAPSSVPTFVLAEVLGGVLAFLVIRLLYPGVTPAEASDVVLPHHLSLSGVDTSARDSAASPAESHQSADYDGSSGQSTHPLGRNPSSPTLD